VRSYSLFTNFDKLNFEGSSQASVDLATAEHTHNQGEAKTPAVIYHKHVSSSFEMAFCACFEEASCFLVDTPGIAI
jgi:hypothetical protein